MPWKISDVDTHKKGLTDNQKEAWVKIANGILSECQKKGGTDCEGRAIRIANTMAVKTKEELEDYLEWLGEYVETSEPGNWKVDDVDSFVKDLSDAQKKIWVKVANTIYKYCQKSGGEDCYGRAIKMASTVAPIVEESIEELETNEKYGWLVKVLKAEELMESIDNDTMLSFEQVEELLVSGKIGFNEIEKRADVSPADKAAAIKKYGDVTYADEKNKKYPLDTPDHVRAAARYIGMPKNREMYSADDLETIDGKIDTAMKKFKIGKYAESVREEIEFVDITEGFKEAKIDEDLNVIKNVAIISKESKNNRIYSDEALNDVIELAEGAKSFADHPVKGMIRSVKMLIGKLTNAHKVDGKGYADFEILENHKNWIFPIAKQMPEVAGMSIIARGKISPEKDERGREVVESVSELKSIDLVSEPATTKSLFEIYENLETNKTVSDNKKEEGKMEKITKEQWDAITVKDIQDNRADVYDKVKNSEELKTAKKELDELKAKEAYRTKKELIEKLVSESELPKEAVTELWKDTLMQVEEKVVDDERVTIKEQVKKLIADRLAVVKSGTIKGSGDEKGTGTKEEITDEKFVEVIKGD